MILFLITGNLKQIFYKICITNGKWSNSIDFKIERMHYLEAYLKRDWINIMSFCQHYLVINLNEGYCFIYIVRLQDICNKVIVTALFSDLLE